MQRLGNLRTAFRSWMTDFPALLTLAGIALLLVVPYFQYRDWAYLGIEFGDEQMVLGMDALERREYSDAQRYFSNALEDYGRPLLIDHPEAQQARRYLSQVLLYLIAGSTSSPYFDEGVQLFAELLSPSGDYVMYGRAGLWALGTISESEEITGRVSNWVKDSNDNLAKIPPDPGEVNDAIWFHYLAGVNFQILFDAEKAQEQFDMVADIRQKFEEDIQIVQVSISGMVLDPDDVPIDGAEITFIRDFNVVTGADGRFSASIDVPSSFQQISYEALSSEGAVPTFGDFVVDLLDQKGSFDYEIEIHTSAVVPEAESVWEILDLADAAAALGNQELAEEYFQIAVDSALQIRDGSLSSSICWRGSQDGFPEVVRPACRWGIDLAGEAATAGDAELARENYQLVVDSVLQIRDASLSNAICWRGSLDGFPEVVLPVCEWGVDVAEEDNDSILYAIRDSRGLARALTGDFEGALEDFQYYVDSGLGTGADVELRIQWIKQLQAGQNPFDDEMLATLRNQ